MLLVTKRVLLCAKANFSTFLLIHFASLSVAAYFPVRTLELMRNYH